MLKKVKNLNWFQKLLLFIIVTILFRNSIFFEFEMIGTYISNAEEPILEMPEKGAKLFIHENGKYSSSSSLMGSGTYQIIGNEIYLANDSSAWVLPLRREYNIGKPKMLLSGDWRYYMIKK